MSGITASLRDGILAAQARQFDRARQLLQQVTVESPNDPVGWFWLAIASESASEAIPCLRRVLELEGAHDQARSALTKLLQSESHRLAASGARADARALAIEPEVVLMDEPASALDAIERGVPLHGFANVRDRVLDKRVEAAPNLPLPA